MGYLRPEIIDYIDLIDFLNSHYLWRKSINSQFSYSMWQTELGLGSRTLLRFILRRQRRISPKTAQVLKSNLKLSSHETDYFDLLLAYTQAKTQTERQAIGSNLTRAQRKHYRPISLKSDVIGIDAIKPIVLALMTYKDMAFTQENLSTILSVDKMKISETLDSLVSSHVISVDIHGSYHFAAEGFKIPETLGNPDLKGFYRYWLDKAKEALELPVETRRYRSLQFALSFEEFIDVQGQINEFATQLLGNYKSTSLKGRRLYMLESVLMPISKEILPDKEPA